MLVVAGWLAFILVYAIYWSPGFDLFQNVIVSIVSLGTAGLLMCGDVLIWYRPNGILRRTRSAGTPRTFLSEKLNESEGARIESSRMHEIRAS